MYFIWEEKLRKQNQAGVQRKGSENPQRRHGGARNRMARKGAARFQPLTQTHPRSAKFSERMALRASVFGRLETRPSFTRLRLFHCF